MPAVDKAASENGPDGRAPPPQRRRTRWWYFKWAVRLGVLAFAVGYLVFVGFDSKFYYPDRTVYDQPEAFGLVSEDVRFPTRDGLTLHGWFFPAQGEARGTVVHFHGNAANVSAHLGLVAWLPGEGYNLLMFDYRGYGESEGKVTRAGTIADGQAALDYALSRSDVRRRPLFFYGQSLGGAVAIVVAADRPEVTAVVAESTFSGYRRIAVEHLRRLVAFKWLAQGIVGLCISSGYDPIDALPRLAPRPLLVIVGGRDEICFPELGRELFAAAGEPKELWEVPEAQHLGVLAEDYSGLIKQITQFFERASPTR
jgi:fermentation-respiration switch protein FrsA (DUF1100 family)